MESEQIYSTLQAELASVQSKVNSWSLNKEKELQQLKSSHTAFLDSHNGASSPLPRRPLQQGLHASNLQRSQAKARLTRAAPSQSSHSSSSPGKSRSRHARRRTRRVRHLTRITTSHCSADTTGTPSSKPLCLALAKM